MVFKFPLFNWLFMGSIFFFSHFSYVKLANNLYILLFLSFVQRYNFVIYLLIL